MDNEQQKITVTKDKIEEKGLVTRRLIDTRKLFTLAQLHGVEFDISFDEALAIYKSETFQFVVMRAAEVIGNELTQLLVDKSVKIMFAENDLWKFLKKKFNFDSRIPFLTGKYVRGGITAPNLVVSTGHKRYADQIGGTATTPMTALAIGTVGTAPAAADTALGGEITLNGGARGAATISNITTSTTGDTEQWQKTWTFTGAETIQEEGIFDNNVSGGTMLAHNTFASVGVASGDSFQITHKIQS